MEIRASAPIKVSGGGVPVFPTQLVLRPYQKEAVASWFAHQGRGTLKMATGSGKTITALAIATELYRKIELQVLLVICPYRHLVSQWGRECERFGLRPLLAFENLHNWQSELSTQLYNVRRFPHRFLTIIATNATFIGEGFQSQLRYFPEKTLIIGDEVHHLGAPRLEEGLPRNIGLRLGLSATPERYFDETGTHCLIDYFGEIIPPELTLGDAIRAGALVSYLYYPMLVNLTEIESFTYAKLTKRIGWALMDGENEEENDNLKALLMQRARLIGAAQNKLSALRQVMENRRHTSHTLFYCGDGTGERSRSQDHQIEAVSRILGTELGYRVNTYTATTPLATRERLRRQFESGELQGLVAIRCLDEGVDIPAIQTAVILASTRNPRQFIQRRGRILRPHPNKQRATLFDAIVVPPHFSGDTLEIERNLLRKELQRFVEFADLADNAGEARVQLLDIQRRYGLLAL
ncbi:DNA phosphorothioation system restriction enzyme [Phormidium sp. CCY1219]|uniref:DNA phosphorothioation system restriction enzyme n=1 Tax=Phormidium sp. CCY1219 TaxID=2886104 RepID=UPI002D1F0A11|nr:DNA phosphorothioation system restriction enzyme [Phormidium sp. CCY1219]MEB3827559.1 DNA phosphorothioation system restriction enzyme [Phormidium sp. CCY1219]